MGTWGVGILSNDLAEDLKDAWLFNLGEGLSPEEVSEGLIAHAQDDGVMDDDEEAYTFWLSFALIQWKSGRLQPFVKEKAMQCLHSEVVESIENSRWEVKSDLKKRIDALEKLRVTLNTPQPAPKKVKPYFFRKTNLEERDIFALKLKSGKYVAMEVVEVDRGIEYDVETSTPIALLFDYHEPEKPSLDQLLNRNIIPVYFDEYDRELHYKITLWATSKRFNEPSDRIEVLGKNPDKRHVSGGYGKWATWHKIDSILEQLIGDYNSGVGPGRDV